VCFRQAIIDIGAQRMQRNLPLDLFFGASDFRPSQSSTDNNPYTLSIRAHGLLHRLFHGTTERNAFLQLLGDTAPNKVGIHLGLANLNYVEPHTLPGLCL
jgi:hypothetical protein